MMIIRMTLMLNQLLDRNDWFIMLVMIINVPKATVHDQPNMAVLPPWRVAVCSSAPGLPQHAWLPLLRPDEGVVLELLGIATDPCFAGYS